MKFALINGVKTEAFKGAKGFCPICSSELIPKCGKIKINHWAHTSIISCDSWWEPETEWHRRWKNYFPVEWQEVTLFDERTKEKHIADIRTAHNLVIEFQHSPIKYEERISRERFYKNMLWVVDGTRLKNDFQRLCKGKDSLFFTKTNNNNVFVTEFPNEVFPANWLKNSVPIIFDFLGISTDIADEIKNTLWCLVPRVEGKTYVIRIKRETFIKTTLNFPTLFQPKPRSIKPKQNIILLPTNRLNQRRGPLIDYIEKTHFSREYKPRTKKH
jgi:competence protein CoiA